MWVALKKILPFTVNKLNLGPVLETNQLFLNWEKIIESVFDKKYKNKSKPISFKNDILTVDCLNSIWALEFQLNQERLVRKINQFFNKETVREVKFIN